MTEHDSKARSKAQYTQHAEGYVRSETHAKGADLERLIALAQPQKTWRVLDVATGGGHTALRFAPHVAEVVASDLTPKMLEKAAAFIRDEKGMTNVRFQEADAETLPFDDEMFDLVTCRIAPHHFPDCAAFVREGARVLKAGGRLLVQDHVLPDDDHAAAYVDAFEKLRDPSHHRAYTQAAWQAMFSAAGLAIQHTEQLTKRHHLETWAQRQGCRPQTISELRQRLHDAPPIAAKWLAGENIDDETASFVNHHLIIMGQKPGAA